VPAPQHAQHLFDLLLVLVFRRQRFNFTGSSRHLIDGIYHRFVVVRDGEIILRLGNIQFAFSLPLSKIGSVSPAVTPIC
jgi:hypothetical protein